jgi:hypothetical protein
MLILAMLAIKEDDIMHTKGKITFDFDSGWGINPRLHVCDETGTVIKEIPLDEEAVRYLEHGREMVEVFKKIHSLSLRNMDAGRKIAAMAVAAHDAYQELEGK